jgi:hypothetical protein
MMNPYVIKKNIALLVVAIVPLIVYVVFSTFYNMLLGIIGMVLSLIIVIPFASLLMRHPFRSIIEGEGLLALDLNSTGILQPFILKKQREWVINEQRGIMRLYNRRNVHYLKPPLLAEYYDLSDIPIKPEVTDADFKLMSGLDPNNPNDVGKVWAFVEELKKNQYYIIPRTEKLDEYNMIIYPKKRATDLRLQLESWITFFYNDNLKDFLTKDDIQKIEAKGIIFNKLEYASTKAQLIGLSMQNFGRYVMSQLGSGFGNILSNPWVKWVIIAVVIILIIMTLPVIWEFFQTTYSGVGTALAPGGDLVTIN